jgi:nucleoside-diphosphate-sugar epimerase
MSGRVLITGGAGFVGRAVLARLSRSAWTPRVAVRRPVPLGDVETSHVGEISPSTDWRAALAGCDAVIHLAARVHVLDERERDAEASFMATNAESTAQLGRAAREAGVSRFVFVSSVKAAAEASKRPLDDSVDPQPQSAYGRSKRAAEITLGEIENLDVTILRPPLVFGPSVGAQFLRLLKLARTGVPLPFGAIRNARSLIAVDALADAIVASLDAAGRRPQPFFVTGGRPLSTPALMAMLRQAMDLPARLLPCPPTFLRAGAALLGRREEMMRLTESLALEDRRFRETFAWSPPRAQETYLAETARWFLAGARDPWQDGREESR